MRNIKRKVKNTKYNVRRKTFSHAHVRSKNGKPSRIEILSNRRLAKSLQVVVNDPKDVRGLSTRDQLFVRNLLKGMSKGDAMKLAAEAIGTELTEKSAVQKGDLALQKPEVESAIMTALSEAGVDDKLIAEKLKEGLDATAFTQHGQEHDDFRTRLGYIQTILKVKGQIGPDVATSPQVLNYTSFREDE